MKNCDYICTLGNEYRCPLHFTMDLPSILEIYPNIFDSLISVLINRYKPVYGNSNEFIVHACCIGVLDIFVKDAE